METTSLDSSTDAKKNNNENTGKDKKKYPPIKEVYITKPGECLIEVAYRHGLSSAFEILDHPENENLKEDIETKNLKNGEIPTGTVINIPESGKGWLSDLSGKVKIILSPKKLWFAAKLKSYHGSPLSGVSYIFKADKQKNIHLENICYNKELDIVAKGDSDENGLIRFEMPYNIKFGELIIWPYGNYNNTKALHYLIEFGSIDNEDTNIGKRKRLANKGFIPVDTTIDKALSENSANLLNHPEKIIPPENFIPDGHKSLLNLSAIEKHYAEELRLVLKKLKREERRNTGDLNLKEYNLLIEKKWRFINALFQIQNQLIATRENIDALDAFFDKALADTHYSDSIRLNKSIRLASLKTIYRKPNEKTIEELSGVIPLNSCHIQMSGGIDVYNKMLEKEEKNIEKCDDKISRLNQFDPVLAEHKSNISQRAKLFERQIEINDFFKEEKQGLIKIGTITDEKPDKSSVENIISNFPEFGFDWAQITDNHLNYAKPYNELVKGTSIYINPLSLELIWNDQEPVSFDGPDLNIPGYDVLIRRQYLIRFDKQIKEDDIDKITDLEIPLMPLQLKFTYNDSIGGTIHNANIIYFASDKKNKVFLEKPKECPVMYPVGVGITNSNGMLVKSPSLESLNKLFSGTRLLNLTKDRLLGQDQGLEIKTSVPVPVDETPAAGFLADDEKKITFAFSDSKAFDDLQKKNKEYADAGLYNKSSMNYFSPDICYGFFVYPAYHGTFKTKSLFELAETKVAENPEKFVITKGLLQDIIEPDMKDTGNIRHIKLFCPLPQWEMRIKEQIAEVLLAVDIYEKSKLPHYRSISILSEIENLTKVNLDFPFWAQDEENIQNKTDLEKGFIELQEHMIDKMENPENPKFKENQEVTGPWKEYKEKIKKEVAQLQAILESDEFKLEMKAYLKNSIENPPKKEDIEAGRIFPAGPYMDIEENWETIFETLAEAYALILRLNTSYSLNDKKTGEMIEGFLEETTLSKSLLEYLEFPEDGFDAYTPAPGLIKEITELKAVITKRTQKSFEDLSFLPSIIVSGYNEYIDKHGLFIEETINEKDSSEIIKGLLGFVTMTPGPPCVLEVIQNHIGESWVKSAIKNRKSSVVAKNLHITMPVLFLKTCSLFGFKTNDPIQFKKAQQAIFEPIDNPASRKKPDSAFAEIFKELKNQKPAVKTGTGKIRPYDKTNGFRSIGEGWCQSAFLLLNIACLVNDFSKNGEKAAEKGSEAVQNTILASVNSWGNAALQAHCAHFLVKKYQKAPPNKILMKSAGFLAGVLSGVTATIYWQETARLIRENADKETIMISRLNAITGTTKTISLAVNSLSRMAMRMIVKHGVVYGTLGLVATAATGVLKIAVIAEFLLFFYSTRKIIAEQLYKLPHGNTALAIDTLWKMFCEDNILALKNQYRDAGYPINNTACFIGAMAATEEIIIKETWGEHINGLIKKIENIHDTTFFTDLDWDNSALEKLINKINPGISWSPMSWHAVIPLYRYGVDPDYISKIVLIPEYLEIDEKKGQIAFMQAFNEDVAKLDLSLLPADYANNSEKIDYIDSVKEIIDFYEYYLNNRDEIDLSMSFEPSDYVSAPPVSIASKIIVELESGTFEPMKYMADDATKFEDWKKWALSIFDAPASQKGLIDLSKLVSSINSLKYEISELKREKKIDDMEKNLESWKKYYQEHPEEEEPATYKIAVMITPIIRGLWQSGNVSMAGLRAVSVRAIFQGENAGLSVEKSDLENKRNKAKEDLNKL